MLFSMKSFIEIITSGLAKNDSVPTNMLFSIMMHTPHKCTDFYKIVKQQRHKLTPSSWLQPSDDNWDPKKETKRKSSIFKNRTQQEVPEAAIPECGQSKIRKPLTPSPQSSASLPHPGFLFEHQSGPLNKHQKHHQISKAQTCNPNPQKITNNPYLLPC